MIQRRQVLIGEASLWQEPVVAISRIEETFHYGSALVVFTRSVQHPAAIRRYWTPHAQQHRRRVGSARRALDVVGRDRLVVAQRLAWAVDFRVALTSILNTAQQC